MSQDPNVIVQNQNQTTTTTDSNAVTDTTTQTTAAVTDTTAAVTDTPVVDPSVSTSNVADTTAQGYVQDEALLEQQPSKVISNGVVGFQIDKVEIEVVVNNYFGDLTW